MTARSAHSPQLGPCRAGPDAPSPTREIVRSDLSRSDAARSSLFIIGPGSRIVPLSRRIAGDGHSRARSPARTVGTHQARDLADAGWLSRCEPWGAPALRIV